MKKYLLLSILLALSCIGFAAISGMPWAYSTGTYTEISGGTVLTSGTTDDAVYTQAIPFTFTFNGVGYTSIKVSTNGFITFGTTSPATSLYTPISATTAYAGAISALGVDQRGRTDGQMMYLTQGAAGSQIATFQWKNWKRYSASAPTDNFNYQVKLYETSNKVEIVYGAFTVDAYAWTYYPQVGLRGSSNADYNNRTTTDNWAATTAGGANTATCTMGAAIYPANGSIFTWTIPAVAALAVSPNPVAFGTSYIGLSKTIPVSLSNSGGANMQVSSVVLTNNTVFQIPNPPSMPQTLTPGGPALTFDVVYTPTGTAGDSDVLTIGDNRASTPVTVSGTGATLLTGEICEAPYLATLPLVDYAGTTTGFNNDYTYAMFTGMTNTSYITGRDWVTKFTIPEAGWLDVSLLNPTGDTSYYYPGMFLVNTIPSVASPAAVLAQHYASTAPLAITDYNIVPGDYYLIVDNWPTPDVINFVLSIAFEPYPSVMAPSGLLTGSIDNDSAELSWTDNNTPAATTWDIKYGGPGFDVETQGTLLSGVTNNPYPLGGLNESSDYDWYVRAVVDGRAVSTWAGPASFTTAQTPATLPLTQTWEAYQGDWGFVNGTQTNAWYVGTADPYAGTYSAYVSNDAGVTNAYTNTATSVVHIYRDIAFDADMLEFPLSFWWKCQGESSYYDYLQVFVVDTSVTPVAGTRLTTGQVGTNYNMLGTTWQQASIVLPGTLSGSVKRLVFSWWNDGSVGTNPPINIDNISLTATELPSGPVAAPLLTSPAPDARDLAQGGFPYEFGWNPAGSEPDTYNLWIANKADLSPTYDSDEFFGVATQFPDVTSPYTPAYTYDYEGTYVWTVVGYSAAYPDEMFQWPPSEFMIQSNPTVVTFPWGETYESGVFPPANWMSYNLDGGTPVWTANATQNHTDGGTTSAFHNYGYTGTEGEDGWLVTPPLQLPVGNYLLDFWHYSSFPTYYTYSGVWATTGNPDPTVGPWTELWNPTSVASAWTYELVNLSAYSGQTVYLAFVYQGYDGHGWWVDDVSVFEAPNWDAAVQSIDVNQVHYTDPFIPKATVKNNGVNAATFTVTMEIGDDYTDVQTVTGLTFGSTQQVSFTSFTPELGMGYPVTVAVALTGDEIPGNDTMGSAFYSLPIDKVAYGDDTYAGDGPMSFNLKTPGVFTDLPSANPFTTFLAGADWMNGGWYGVENHATDAPFWQVDPVTGAGTQIGLTGYPSYTGVAFDSNHNILYGCTTTDLYTIDPTTGASTWLADLTATWDVFVLSIAYDTIQDKLFAHDIAYDALFEINTTTYACEPATGYTYGTNFNYQQDLAFDRETGLLYLAGSWPTAGGLFWIDPWDAYAWYIGPFQNNTLVAGFAIPYSDELVPPVVGIGDDGTISWDPIAGAGSYDIYSADTADGVYSFVTNTLNTSWLDPNFPEDKKFYYVKANSASTRQAFQFQNATHLGQGQRLTRSTKRSNPESWYTPPVK